MVWIHKNWSKITAGLALTAALGVGAVAVQSYLASDCCATGAACCKPGSPCCRGGSHASKR